MEYIKEGYTLPVPFNLIPTISSIKIMYNLIKSCLKKRAQGDQTNNTANKNNNNNNNNINNGCHINAAEGISR